MSEPTGPSPANRTPPPNASVTLEAVSDVICPWCYVGKKRMERALAAVPELSVTVHWLPFLLDPAIPRDGLDRQAYLREKFGDRPKAQAVETALLEAGEEEGIAFAFDKITRTPNTIDAHRLILWSRSTGCQPALVERLFQMYFVEGRDIGAPEVLIEAANAVGMDAHLTAQLLVSERDVDRVVKEVSTAYRIGVTGVPTFILNGRYALVGAQDVDHMADVLRRLAAGEDFTQSAAGPTDDGVANNPAGDDA